MNTCNEQKTGQAFDKLKWILVLILLALVVYGNFYFSEPNSIYQPNLVVRIVVIVVVSFLALGVAATTQKGKDFISFAKESRTELRKVVWPTRKETVQTTLLIGVITVIVGLFIWGLDVFLFWLVSILTTLGH